MSKHSKHYAQPGVPPHQLPCSRRTTVTPLDPRSTLPCFRCCSTATWLYALRCTIHGDIHAHLLCNRHKPS